MTLQIAGVIKPLASVGRNTAKGHCIALDGNLAYIEHKQTDRRAKLDKKGKDFLVHMKFMPTKANMKGGGNAMGVAMLGKSGFTQHEDSAHERTSP